METKQIVLLLLIISIILSGISVVLSLSAPSADDYLPASCGTVTCPGSSDDSTGATISFDIIEPSGGTG